jgi:hypothetical protein
MAELPWQFMVCSEYITMPAVVHPNFKFSFLISLSYSLQACLHAHWVPKGNKDDTY